MYNITKDKTRYNGSEGITTVISCKLFINKYKGGINMFKQIRRGDIFEVDLGEYRGSIQGGYRPCVVVQNDIGNKYSPVTIIYPLTTKINSKKNIPTHVIIESIETDKPSMILCEQPITINKTQLKRYRGSLGLKDIEKMNKATIISLGL